MRLFAALATLLLSVVACQQPKSPVSTDAHRWTSCRLPGLAEPAQCAVTHVFENRGRQTGRKIAIHVARLKSSKTNADSPLIFIAGGPGQGASHVAASVLGGLRRVRRTRDLLFVDLRGTGRSGALGCDLQDVGSKGLRDLFEAEFPADKLAACAQSYNADLSQYTTANAVDDLEQMRQELQLGQVNVLGVSYGTRVALTWMRRHPKAIRAAVLDSVAPPQMRLFAPFATDAERAWQLVVRDCEANLQCRQRFPRVRGSLRRLLGAVPPTVEVRHPVTGGPVTLKLTRAGVAMAVRGLLYSAELAALLPLVIDQALSGQWQPLVAQTLLLSHGAAESMSVGLMLSTVCREDAPRLAAVDLSAAVSGTFLGRHAVDPMRQACAVWPSSVTQTDAVYAKAVVSDVPTLLLSGEADPVTPPRWAALAMKTLTHSHHIVFRGMGHSVASKGCGPRAIAAFFTEPSAAPACELSSQRPAFFLTPSGPAP